MRKYHRRQAPIACECGVRLKSGSGLPQHKRSLLHRHATRLRALLDTCLNFSMIGRRLGISRERVRQLASALGYESGIERRTLCRLKIGEAEAVDSPMVKALRQSCPYPVELIRTPSAGEAFRFFASEVMILGKRCATHKANYKSGETVHFSYSRGYSGLCEFSLVLLPDGRWVVCRSLKSGSTCFKVGKRLTSGTKGSYHGWNERIGAWHVLKRG